MAGKNDSEEDRKARKQEASRAKRRARRAQEKAADGDAAPIGQRPDLPAGRKAAGQDVTAPRRSHAPDALADMTAAGQTDPTLPERPRPAVVGHAVPVATSFAAQAGPAGAISAPALARPDPALLLGDIDAWNLREAGDWLRFDARLEDHPRAYLRARAGGAIIADAPGPLLAILGLGGPRSAGFTQGPPRFRWNLLAPGDDIGAVGAEGTAITLPVAGLQPLPHRPSVALLGDALLAARFDAKRGLPLILTRVETAPAPDVGALAQGTAFANFCTALDSLTAAAASLGRPAQVLAVSLDYGLEDLTSPAPALAAGIRALMAGITARMRQRGLVPPVFLRRAEAGTAYITDHPAIRADAELARCPGPHDLRISCPSYMLDQDAHGRLTDQGRADLAGMERHCLDTGPGWTCPLPLLAEYRGTRIRVMFRAAAALVVDGADPFHAGPAAGFDITGTDGPVAITAITPAPDDPKTLILTTDRPPTGPAPRLRLACGGSNGPNRSAIRDDWQDGPLHRWALPADLPLHPAPAPREAP